MGHDAPRGVGHGNIKDAGFAGGFFKQMLEPDIGPEAAAHAGACSGFEGLDERGAFFQQQLGHVAFFPAQIDGGHDNDHQGQDAGRTDDDKRRSRLTKGIGFKNGHGWFPQRPGRAGRLQRRRTCLVFLHSSQRHVYKISKKARPQPVTRPQCRYHSSHTGD